jgi:hypothetical protein
MCGLCEWLHVPHCERVGLVGSHGRWKGPCLDSTSHPLGPTQLGAAATPLTLFVPARSVCRGGAPLVVSAAAHVLSLMSAAHLQAADAAPPVLPAEHTFFAEHAEAGQPARARVARAAGGGMGGMMAAAPAPAPPRVGEVVAAAQPGEDAARPRARVARAAGGGMGGMMGGGGGGGGVTPGMSASQKEAAAEAPRSTRALAVASGGMAVMLSGRHAAVAVGRDAEAEMAAEAARKVLAGMMPPAAPAPPPPAAPSPAAAAAAVVVPVPAQATPVSTETDALLQQDYFSVGGKETQKPSRAEVRSKRPAPQSLAETYGKKGGSDAKKARKAKKAEKAEAEASPQEGKATDGNATAFPRGAAGGAAGGLFDTDKKVRGLQLTQLTQGKGSVRAVI